MEFDGQSTDDGDSSIVYTDVLPETFSPNVVQISLDVQQKQSTCSYYILLHSDTHKHVQTLTDEMTYRPQKIHNIYAEDGLTAILITIR
jgi:ribosomal silencing factor RsfS